MVGTSILAGYGNEDGDGTGTRLICTSPYTQLKKLKISYTHTHTQSMWGFSVKTETNNTHENGFICHPIFSYSSLYSIIKVWDSSYLYPYPFNMKNFRLNGDRFRQYSQKQIYL